MTTTMHTAASLTKFAVALVAIYWIATYIIPIAIRVRGMLP